MTNSRFNLCNENKKNIDKGKCNNFFVKPGEIWYIKMGINIGFEENGKNNFLRPVLVLKKTGNLFFTVAMTSKGKDDNIFYHRFKEINLKNPKYISSSYAILSQVKTIDKKRFFENAGIISRKENDLIKKDLEIFYFKSYVFLPY